MDDKNNRANVGDDNDVDLFELSNRIEKADSIRRSIENEYDDDGTHSYEFLSSDQSYNHAYENPKNDFDNFSQPPRKTPIQTEGHAQTQQKYAENTDTVARRRIGINQLIIFLLIAVGICVIMGLVLLNNAIDGVNYVEINTDWSDVKAESAPNWTLRSDPDVTNILLLGIDGDGGKNQRSDTIMILTLDGKNDAIKMTSILRDTYVSIPGRKSKTRINHSYAYGGASLTMQTVESNFRIDLERYVGIDMDGLTVVADKLGGVDIELTKAEASVINNHVKNSELKDGMQHLNGAQATYYARIRKIDSDFGRTGRQRKLIKAMLAKFKEMNIMEQYSVVSDAAPYITTNYSKRELFSVALKAMGMLDSDMEELSIPVKGSYKSQKISGMSVLVPDVDENCRELHKFIFGSLPE